MSEKKTAVQVKLAPEQLARLDQWREGQTIPPNRTKACEYLIQWALDAALDVQ